MRLVANDERAQMRTQLVVRVGGNMVEFVHGDKPVIESRHAELVHGKAEGGVGTDQHFIVAVKEHAPDRIDFAAIVTTRRVAEVPFRDDLPVCPKAKLTQWLRPGSSRRSTFSGNDDDRLLESLVLQLVQGDEHECTALARSGR